MLRSLGRVNAAIDATALRCEDLTNFILTVTKIAVVFVVPEVVEGMDPDS
jgi:hypothetical protein